MVTTDGSTTTLWRDGITVATASSNVIIDTLERDYHYIGKRENSNTYGCSGGRYWEGTIAYIRFWHGLVLDADQVLELYTTSTFQPTPVPSLEPSTQPTLEPSTAPSTLPTIQPSSTPTLAPTELPTFDGFSDFLPLIALYGFGMDSYVFKEPGWESSSTLTPMKGWMGPFCGSSLDCFARYLGYSQSLIDSSYEGCQSSCDRRS